MISSRVGMYWPQIGRKGAGRTPRPLMTNDQKTSPLGSRGRTVGALNLSDLKNPRGDGLGIAAARGDTERLDQHLAGPRRLDDRVDPESSSGVADVGLAVVPLAQLVGESVELGLVD